MDVNVACCAWRASSLLLFGAFVQLALLLRPFLRARDLIPNACVSRLQALRPSLSCTACPS